VRKHLYVNKTDQEGLVALVEIDWIRIAVFTFQKKRIT